MKFNILINYVSLIINLIKYYYLRALCHDVGAAVYNTPHTIIVSGCKNKSYSSSTILS